MDTRQAGHKRAGTATSLSMSSAQLWHMQCLEISVIACEADALYIMKMNDVATVFVFVRRGILPA
jgi:hypothetical protein